jgi:hypothetical protein
MTEADHHSCETMASGGSENRSRPFPYGVASEAGDVGASLLGDTLVVMDLASGRTMAEIPRSCWPLAVCGKRVVAWEQVGESSAAMRLVVFELAEPSVPKLVSDPIIFPGWMEATTLSVQSLCVILHDDRLTIEWCAQSRYAGGAPPSRELEAQLMRAACGTAIVDLRSGAVDSKWEAVVPKAAVSEGEKSVDYEGGASWSDEPWTESGRVRLSIERRAEEQQIVLHKTDQRGRSEVVQLASGVRLKATLTGDRRYVLVHDEALPDSSWRLYPIDPRAKAAAIPYEASAREVNVVGGTIYYMVDDPERGPGAVVLKARSLDTGNLLWKKSLGPLRKRALPRPPPPGAAPGL